MTRTKKITRGAGKVTLALLAAVLIPVLIWVALGAFVREITSGRRVQRKPATTIGNVLAAT